MFYSGGNYMQDLNYFNQNYGTNYCNPYFPNNMQAISNNTATNVMYPAVYRIISPVVWQVLQNSNTQFFTEEMLNSMVDTVYNIVEGDIKTLDKQKIQQNQSENQTNINRDRNQVNSNNCCNEEGSTNSLLKDLIKIIFLKDIENIEKSRLQPNMNRNNYFNF